MQAASGSKRRVKRVRQVNRAAAVYRWPAKKICAEKIDRSILVESARKRAERAVPAFGVKSPMAGISETNPDLRANSVRGACRRGPVGAPHRPIGDWARRIVRADPIRTLAIARQFLRDIDRTIGRAQVDIIYNPIGIGIH